MNFKNGSAKWTLYSSADSLIDLDKSVSTNDQVMAYAYTEIEADKSGLWFLGLGSDDGGSLWINGLKLWDYTLPRSLSVDDDMIPVILSKGINKVLLKIEDRGNKWGFCARMLPFSIGKLVERGSLFSITSGLNGEAMIVSGW